VPHNDTTTSEASAPDTGAADATDTPPAPNRRRRAAQRPAGPPAATFSEPTSTDDKPAATTGQPEPAAAVTAAPVFQQPDATSTPPRRRRQAASASASADSTPQEPSSTAGASSGKASGSGKEASASGTSASGKSASGTSASAKSGSAKSGSAKSGSAKASGSASSKGAKQGGGRRGQGTSTKQADEQPGSSPAKDADTQADGANSSGPSGDASEHASTGTDADTSVDDATDTSGDSTGDETAGGQRRRRRRGGRGRRKPAGAAGDDASAESMTDDASDGQHKGEVTGEKTSATPATTDAEGDDGDDAKGADNQTDARDESDAQGQKDTPAGGGDEGGGGSTSSRRRRRRRRKSDSNDGEPRTDDPEETVVRVRESRSSDAQITATKGSTRVEAKKQRRRDGRDSGRRRPSIMSESEFLARRESVERVLVVRQRGDREAPLTQLAVLEDGMLVEHYVDQGTQRSIIGNIYLGKVQNVLPAMEAAFVDIGRGRNAILYAGEVDWSQSEGKPKRIEEALSSGQSVLVQVTKDPIGHKGARLTSSISLPGRFVVYVPGGSMSGISRKLSDTERSRLRQILKDVVPDEAEVIIRTAAEGAGESELRSDVARLTAQWEDIERKSQSASAPATLYAEPDLTLKIVRDLFNEDFTQLVVSGDDAWDTIEPYVSHVAPGLADRLRKWDGDSDVFEHYRVDEQIAKALERKVWLPSGGSLVIDRTEAMTVVDVNTGKFTGGGGNLEETVTKNNLEAAEEVARQLRLRDIGGIVVIDFIDMVLGSNRDLVLRRLVECLARDRTRHQVAEVTSLGLVQMTRKRIGTGLLETFSTSCECCNGRGLTTTSEPVPVPASRQDAGQRRSRSRRTTSTGKGTGGSSSSTRRRGSSSGDDAGSDDTSSSNGGG
jgi:ribonuclease E